MIDKFISPIPITTFLLLFLFGCGGLYLVGYWSTFDVTLLALADIMEIPKTFILPFALGMGLIMLQVVIMSIFTGSRKPSKFNVAGLTADLFKSISPEKLDVITINFMMLAFALSFLFPKSTAYWLISIPIYTFLLIIRLILLPSVKNYIIKSRIYAVLFFYIVLLPIMSFQVGKMKALYIYNNSKETKRINQASITNNNSISLSKEKLDLKLLGFLGGNCIISTLDNERIFILDKASMDGMEIYENKKKK